MRNTSKNIAIQDLVNYLDDLLQPTQYPERSFLNGLIVEGNNIVQKIIGIVSPNILIFQKIVKEEKPEVILAHHGLLKLEGQPIRGVLKKRIKYLLENNISYISYHIPLDAHPKFGNNYQLAKKLKLRKLKRFGKYHGIYIGFAGEIAFPLRSKKELKAHIKKVLGVNPIEIFWPKRLSEVQKIAVISGAGARPEFLEEASLKKIDCYITGNVDENIGALSEEANVVFVALGHYNSEKWGVISLGKHLQRQFGIQFRFIDFPERW